MVLSDFVSAAHLNPNLNSYSVILITIITTFLSYCELCQRCGNGGKIPKPDASKKPEKFPN